MILLRVPGLLVYRNLALRVVSAACKMAFDLDGAEDETEAQAVSAFGEAFNNVAIHSYGNGGAGDIQIDIVWTRNELVIDVTDDGRGFDPSSIASPDPGELPEGKMGLFIMRSFLDEIEYRPGPPNVLRMVKRRDDRAAVRARRS